MVVFIVASQDLIHRVYSRFDLADRHAKSITGCAVVAAEIHDQLAEEVRDDLSIEAEFDEDEATPVTEFENDEIDKHVFDVSDIDEIHKRR